MSKMTDFLGGGIKSIQRGEAVGSATITINPVDITKSFVNSSFVSLGSTSKDGYTQWNSSGIGWGYGYGFGKVGGKVKLVDSSTLEIVTTDNNTTTSWEVIEYA